MICIKINADIPISNVIFFFHVYLLLYLYPYMYIYINQCFSFVFLVSIYVVLRDIVIVTTLLPIITYYCMFTIFIIGHFLLIITRTYNQQICT